MGRGWAAFVKQIGLLCDPLFVTSSFEFSPSIDELSMCGCGNEYSPHGASLCAGCACRSLSRQTFLYANSSPFGLRQPLLQNRAVGRSRTFTRASTCVKKAPRSFPFYNSSFNLHPLLDRPQQIFHERFSAPRPWTPCPDRVRVRQGLNSVT